MEKLKIKIFIGVVLISLLITYSMVETPVSVRSGKAFYLSKVEIQNLKDAADREKSATSAFKLYTYYSYYEKDRNNALIWLEKSYEVEHPSAIEIFNRIHK